MLFSARRGPPHPATFARPAVAAGGFPRAAGGTRRSTLSTQRLPLLLALLAVSLPVGGQEREISPPDPGADTVVVTAEPEYAAGGLHRLLFGDGYRDLWTLPARVQVLDMETTAGGLEAEFRVGGAQTKGLAIAGADGKSYTFRAVDKDPTSILPPELRGTPFEKIVQDQISSSFPGAPLVANPLARAVGVPQVEARLIVLPDSPRLGEFRAEFAGLLGTFEEYPTIPDSGPPGTFGALEIVDGRDFFARITADWATRVDAHAYLRARLLDLVLGDWDRHVEQWRYARLPDRALYQPIPEDRDQAFSRYDGLLMWVARDREPKFDVFGPDYTPLEGLAWNSRTVDRRFLAGIEREAYLEAARQVQAALTDAVIEEAVRTMPAAYHALRGERLASELRARRDALVGEAEELYRFLALEVDVRTTNAAELVRLERRDDGVVRITVVPLVGEAPACEGPHPGGEPVFDRTFLPGETDEVRVYLGGGDDRVLIDAGARHLSGDVRVRVIAGAGDNRVCHPTSGRSWSIGLDDADEGGRGDEILDGIWLPPAETIEERGNPAATQGPAATAMRDWGSTVYRVSFIGVEPQIGPFVGSGVAIERFGFRQRPYASRHQIRGGFAFGAGQFRFDYEGDFRLENRRTHLRVRALASGIEVINFFGFGNESEGEEEEFFEVRQQQLGVESRAFLPFGQHGWISSGPIARFVRTTTDEPDRLISQLRPYGIESTGQVGWVAGIGYNNREFPGSREIKATDDLRRMGPPDIGPGLAFDVDGRYYPELFGLEDDYLSVEGAATGWIHFGQFAPALGIRLGGQKNWGEAPYYDSAFLGGRQLRGLPLNRFAGDSSLYGNLGLLLSLAEVDIVVPGRVGIMTHVGGGRVWLADEDSDVWHWSAGGGIWWAPWTMSTALRLGAAESDEGFSVYLLTGFGF